MLGTAVTVLGLVLQVLVLAVQNVVDYRDLGVATLGVTFFRSIGAAFGVAIFGTIFTNRLRHGTDDAVRGTSLPPGVSVDSLLHDPRGIGALPAALRGRVLDSYADAITDVFLYAVPVVAIAHLLAGRCARTRCARTRCAAASGPRTPARRCRRRPWCARPTTSVRGPSRCSAPTPGGAICTRGSPNAPASTCCRPPAGCCCGSARTGRSSRRCSPSGSRGATDRGRDLTERLAHEREEELTALLGDWWGPERPRDLVDLVRELSTELGAGPRAPREVERGAERGAERE